MTSIPAPYAISTDAAARRWWAGLSDETRRALKRSWRDDDRQDPLLPTARRLASYLNARVLETEPAGKTREPRVPRGRDFQMRRNRLAVYWSLCSARGLRYKVLDHGMFWPLERSGGRMEIARRRLSAEQHELLCRHEASG